MSACDDNQPDDAVERFSSWRLTWPVLPLAGLFVFPMFFWRLIPNFELNLEYSRETWIFLTGSDEQKLFLPRFGQFLTYSVSLVLKLTGILMFVILARFSGWSGNFPVLRLRKTMPWLTIGVSLLICVIVVEGVRSAYQSMTGDPLPMGDLSERNPLLYANFPTAVLFFGKWVVTPISEEVVFRAGLQRLISKRLGVWVAVVVQAVVFGLFHYGQGIYGVFLTGVGGLLIGCLYLISGRLWPCIVCHALLNLYGGWGNLYWLFSGRPQ